MYFLVAHHHFLQNHHLLNHLHPSPFYSIFWGRNWKINDNYTKITNHNRHKHKNQHDIFKWGFGICFFGCFSIVLPNQDQWDAPKRAPTWCFPSLRDPRKVSSKCIIKSSLKAGVLHYLNTWIKGNIGTCL